MTQKEREEGASHTLLTVGHDSTHFAPEREVGHDVIKILNISAFFVNI